MYIESDLLIFIYECSARARRSIVVLTFSARRGFHRHEVCYCTPRNLLQFFFLIHARHDARAVPACVFSQAGVPGCSLISRRWKSRRRLRDAPVCNLVIDSPTFSALFPSVVSFPPLLPSTRAHRVPRKSRNVRGNRTGRDVWFVFQSRQEFSVRAIRPSFHVASHGTFLSF